MTVGSIQNASSGLYVRSDTRFSCRCSSVAAIFPTSTGTAGSARPRAADSSMMLVLLFIVRVQRLNRPGVATNPASACQLAALLLSASGPLRRGPSASVQRLGPTAYVVSDERRGRVGGGRCYASLARRAARQATDGCSATNGATQIGGKSGPRPSGTRPAGAGSGADRRGNLRRGRRFAATGASSVCGHPGIIRYSSRNNTVETSYYRYSCTAVARSSRILQYR